MCISDTDLDYAFNTFRKELLDAGILIDMGVEGSYGRTEIFEKIVNSLEVLIAGLKEGEQAQIIRFPPLMSKIHYCASNHFELFPNLIGTVSSFKGTGSEHAQLVARKNRGEDWSAGLSSINFIATPAACYPLYPVVKSPVPNEGRMYDLQSYIFRHEPSNDPARMQQFRQFEFVKIGSKESVVKHRDSWLEKAIIMFKKLELPVEKVVANDPFFGRSAKLMSESQKAHELKYEIVVAITSNENKTAICSGNYHMDSFGEVFGIRLDDNSIAHTSCVGFGLERITLALLKTHGFNINQWPENVKANLNFNS